MQKKGKILEEEFADEEEPDNDDEDVVSTEPADEVDPDEDDVAEEDW
jgi:hypothetical protein